MALRWGGKQRRSFHPMVEDPGILAVTNWWSRTVSHMVADDGLQGLCGTFTRGMANHPDTVLKANVNSTS
ncbi:hypothetical protein HispidOSU_023547 [Sigmodon hispidus]